MTKNICALIPARKGSKGVPDKNIKLLAGHPLLAYSIAAAKLTPEISRIIVSTDSKVYAEIARKYGAETPFLRPDSISTDSSTDFEVFVHCINWLKANNQDVPESFVHLRPTTPLRLPALISEAISATSLKPNTSLRSGHKCSESPYKWFKINNMGYFTTLDDKLNLESTNRARQEFPDIFVPDGYVDLVYTEQIITNKALHGDQVYAFKGPQTSEVDTPSDFDYLEFLMTKELHPLKAYLDKVAL